MEVHGRFRTPLTPAEAIAQQLRLRSLVVPRGRARARTVAGVDVSEKGNVARAAIVVMRDFEPIEQVTAESPVPFPYIPGLLSFREIPPLLAVWKKLKTAPDLVIVDGQGYAHPRRFGIACHLGIILDRPTLGCAKSLLVGAYEEPASERGAWSPLLHKGEIIGAALRTQTGRNVVYVSVGHRLSLTSAIRAVLAWAPRYRLPEPQRRADFLSKN